MKLDTVDELIALASGQTRSLDCIFVFTPNELPALTSLRLGAEHAQKLFTKTAKHQVSISETSSLETFVNAPLPSPFHLELVIIDKKSVALKMSHLLGDAVSMYLWIEAVLFHEVSNQEAEAKSYPSKKDSPYRKWRNSKVWPRPVTAAGIERKFLRFTLSHPGVAPQSLNDILILALLESIPFDRKSIWLPVNVRKDFFKGFGNVLSRLRVYPPPAGSVREKLAHIKKQKIEAKTNGEISLPPKNLDISSPLKRMLFTAWLKRPWADWATISFSHVQDTGDKLGHLKDVGGVTNIMPAHHAAIFAYSTSTQTNMTLTYDPVGVSLAEATELVRVFQKTAIEMLDEKMA